MNRREQFDAARRIVEIRRLQLERTRIETLRCTQAFERAGAHEAQVRSDLESLLDVWRNALLTPAGLSPALAMNWAGAAAAVRVTYQRARQDTQDAFARVDLQRAEMACREQQAEHASDVADRARRRFQRACEEQQASRIEDMYLSPGDRS
jgi:hypothetical protein